MRQCPLNQTATFHHPGVTHRIVSSPKPIHLYVVSAPRQPHRTARVQFLRADRNLCAEAKLAAVLKRVEAFTYTAEESTSFTKRSALRKVRVRIASGMYVPCLRMCAMASSRSATIFTFRSSDRNSSSYCSAFTGTTLAGHPSAVRAHWRQHAASRRSLPSVCSRQAGRCSQYPDAPAAFLRCYRCLDAGFSR